MKLVECLPIDIANVIAKYNDIREIRLRNNDYCKVNVSGNWLYLGSNSLVKDRSSAVVLDDVCYDVITQACANSLYKYEDMLAQGYFTLSDGTRFGVCGTQSSNGVFNKYTSVCIRVPHCVSVCSNNLLDKLMGNNVVVIGKPSSGKTTLLRDIALKLGESANVLVVDERGELFYDGIKCNCDVLRFCNKRYAFQVAVRSMSPDYVLCDELAFDEQQLIRNALCSGVKVICTVHGNDLDDFKQKYDCIDLFNLALLLRQNNGNFDVFTQIIAK